MVWAFNLGSTGSGRWMEGAIQCSCGLCFVACVSTRIPDILFGGGHMTSHFVPVPLIFDLTNEELFVHLRHVCCVYTSQPLCM